MELNWIGLATLIRREIERIMRVKVQTIAAPLISATLFIFIFGFILGARIEEIAGVPYMQFVFPGILTMNVLSSAFEHTASAVYFGRWIKSIHEVLVAPFSYIEMVLGYVGSAVLRSLAIGTGIVIIGLLFGAVTVTNPILFVLTVIGVATIFALVGMLVGLWANGFEQLGLLNTFVIMPLSFLGGMFYSIEFLPTGIKAVTLANPFFYLIDAMRYSTIGITEGNGYVSLAIILGLIVGLGALVIYLFRAGWRIRE